MEQLKNQNVTQIASESKTWLQKHEKLVIVLLLIIAGYFAIDKGLGIASSYESHRAQQAAAVTSAQAVKNATVLSDTQQLLNSYQQQLATFAAANQKLTSAIATRDQQLVTQQKTDTQLQPSELALRWAALVRDSGVQATATGYTVTPSAALATVQQVEELPVLTQDVADEKAKEINLQSDLDTANAVIGDGKEAVRGLQISLTDQYKQCKIEIADEKAKARKGKFKSFGLGYGLGFVSGVALRFF